ncbi:hypothetical protein [Sphingomonas sp. ACRSK]|uniref:hypothetical protein n=1 Tax=Sphingomonas sp. ACRSK TaxID=2918213 RepID=UPI001EF4F083|nr:hypothetical protein [Sphingomonas sp. ACRSK]MCG7348951.1 hypothetical protein [Sphingomonas sp. ACRSK]
MTDELTTSTKSFPGNYLLFRKDGHNLKRRTGERTARPPRFRHPTFESAETEAQRLLGKHPQSTFVILQEVGRVKALPADLEPKQPRDGDGTSVFEAHAAWVRRQERPHG